MRLLNTNDIALWAETVECKYHLPHLIRKLIIATVDVNSIKSIHFTYGEDVQTGGYDGELLTDSENLYVPYGESVWEFGTTNKKKAKADEDYQKRKDNALGKDPKNTTYVNINGKKYQNKKRWTEEKKAEGFWKDILYFDAVDIEQWLELAPSVELWLAEKLGKPTFGIYTLEEYWLRWSGHKNIKILPEIIAGNSRRQEIEEVKKFMYNDEGVLYIKSINKDEALVFPVAVIEQMDLDEKTNLTVKTLVVDNRESFNKIIQSKKPLIIIVKSSIESTDISGAIHKGHKLIIPLTPSDVTSSKKIDLPIVSLDNFESGLINMGVDSEQARLLTKKTGRNISVLRRVLELDYVQPKWLQNIVNISEIIPILLVNRFNKDCEKDKEIIEHLYGKPYSDYEKFLNNLLNQEDTPVYHINGIWRLISPTDIWLYVAKFISKEDFEKLNKVCLDTLTEIAYKYTLPLEDIENYFQISRNDTEYSLNIKEGLCETLAIISSLGEKYGICSIASPESFVDSIVNQILEKDIIVWRSLSTNLYILSEASPCTFLNNLERVIKDKSVIGFFEVKKGFFHISNDLACLLWCLNIIGWMPENLKRVSVALCELIDLSPDELPTSNTPFDTLKSIFRIWYPQTNSNAEERKKVLELLIRKYPDIMYSLMVNMIDSKMDTAMHIPRPKFRLFSELRRIQVTHNEVSYLKRFCIDNIILLIDNQLNRILNLVDLLDDVDRDKIEDALKSIESGLKLDDEIKNKIYQKFRVFIGSHRTYPNTHLSLDEDILNVIEKTAIKFKPEDYILNEKYLFENYAPILIEGRNGNDFEKQEQIVSEKRKEFVCKVIAEFGISKVFELSDEVQSPHLYGNTLAIVDSISHDDILKIYQMVDSENPKQIFLVHNYIKISESRSDRKTQLEILVELKKSGLSDKGIINFLHSLCSCVELWVYIQDNMTDVVESLYWKSQNQYIFVNSKKEFLFALDKLQKYKKSITFLNTLGINIRKYSESDLSSEDIIEMLENVDIIDFEDGVQFDHYGFVNILEVLYSKDDYDVERGAKVEMKFHFVFKDYDSPKPHNLFKIMSKKPSEFMGVLSQIYLPTDDKLKVEMLDKIKMNENSESVFKFSNQLLDSFNYIPSLKSDESIDGKILNEWVDEVRKIAKESYREFSTDNCIGKLLAKYPINISEGKGFPFEIYEIIENINTESIKDAFEVQLSNNLGYTSRGAFEGGEIERYNASFYNKLFEETKITHPNVSLIFKSLSTKYLAEGLWEDENAVLRSL